MADVQGWTAGPAPADAWTAGPAPTADFRTSNEKDAQGKPIVDSLMDYAKEATAGFNPVAINHAIQSAFWHPIDTTKGVLAAQDVPRQKGVEAFKKGDYATGTRHFVDWLIPLLGPRLDQAADWMQQGEYAKGLGATTDVAAQIAIPAVAEKIAFNGPRLISATKNPVEAAAVNFGKQQGVLIDAGTETGSQFVKNLQKRAGATWGGANVAETAQKTQGAQLSALGDRLSDQVHPTPVQPVQAGEGVSDSLRATMRDLNTKADTAYNRLGVLEQQRGLTVNIAPARSALVPLYEDLKRQAALVPLQGDKAKVLVALDRLFQPSATPEMPLTIVDKALGDLKSLARADIPELRTAGQGAAAEAVKQLETAVQSAARRGGPDVLDALTKGRAATVEKYRVADVFDLLRDEPRGVFDQLTARKDGGLNKLRAVQAVAPDELPKLGRAMLEELLDKPTSEGGFKFADKARADWERLGPQTKQMLFGSRLNDLDNFFMLAKKIGENPNPSGTAQVLNATQVLVGIPGYALAKILYSPSGTRLLTNAIKISVNAAPAARAAAVAQIVRAAQEAGVSVPRAAETPMKEATR